MKIDAEVVKELLVSFFHAFPRLAMTLPDEYNREFVDEFPEDQEASDDKCNTASSTGATNAINDSDPDSNQQLEEEKDNRRCYENSCKSCFSCVFKVLYQFGVHSTAYSGLYCLYKDMMTLTVTQVECERSFSLLKIIKSRQRSILSQDKSNQLEAFMLLSIERRVLNDISNDDIVDLHRNGKD